MRNVRQKWLRYSPSDIEKMTDIEELEMLLDLYFPSEQPRTAEEAAYIEEMHACISRRLNVLTSLNSTNNFFNETVIDISSDSCVCLS